MERTFGADTYFVRVLGVYFEDLDNIRDDKAPPNFQAHQGNAMEGGGRLVGTIPNIARPAYAWVQETPLPYAAYIQNTRTAEVGPAGDEAYKLLEQEVRKQGGAVEVYSRAQVDDLVQKALKQIPSTLVDECIKELEAHLIDRTAGILKEIAVAQRGALDAIEDARKKAIDEIKKATT